MANCKFLFFFQSNRGFYWVTHSATMLMQLLRSKYRTELEPRVKEKLQTGDVIAPDLKTAISVKKWWTSSWFEQFFILSRRNCKERRKDYLNVLRFAQGVAVALLLGMLWWRPNLDTEQDIRDQVGLSSSPESSVSSLK